MYDPAADTKVICWCLSIWTLSTPSTNACRRLETCGICISFPVGDIKLICPNRGGIGNYMGTWQVCHGSPWKEIQDDTDHKPLVPLLSSKHLSTLPPRILQFRLHLNQFNFGIQHIPGKEVHTASSLSWSSLSRKEGSTLEELAKLAMVARISHLPASRSTIWSKLKLQTPYVPS